MSERYYLEQTRLSNSEECYSKLAYIQPLYSVTPETSKVMTWFVAKYDQNVVPLK